MVKIKIASPLKRTLV